jgi:dienelactone hydrolase
MPVPDCTIYRPLGEPAKPFAFPVPAGSTAQQERAFYSAGMERRLKQLKTAVDFLSSPACFSRFLDLAPRSGSQVINPSRVHYWGHSYGGGTVAAMGCREPAASVVCLDGWMYPVPCADRTRGLQVCVLRSV